ncbi:shikimate dehydrogenase [Streptomyces sp. NPDC093085]|uniref:shikimate dehydrogenase family protein n=1 Tax=Streptomyces sp. NPDC093085 TaxID=3155068 RepID=UPI00343BF735
MKLALLGSPVHGALSPVLHRAAYAALGLNWTYHAIDCRPADLPHHFAEARAGRWRGFSLTMPLKAAAVPLLDDVTDTVVAAGAANTIVVRDGRLYGDNTDVHGMVQALRTAGVTAVSEVTVLGAGATACTALAAARELGCHQAVAVARDTAGAHSLATVAERTGIGLVISPWADAAAHLTAGLVRLDRPPRRRRSPRTHPPDRTRHVVLRRDAAGRYGRDVLSPASACRADATGDGSPTTQVPSLMPGRRRRRTP